jgi:hypothetical protein
MMLLRTGAAVGLTEPALALTLPAEICESSALVATVVETNVLPATVSTKSRSAVGEIEPVLEVKVTAGALANKVLVAGGITIFPDDEPSFKLCKN